MGPNLVCSTLVRGQLVPEVSGNGVLDGLAPELGLRLWIKQVVYPARGVKEEYPRDSDLHLDLFGQGHLALQDLLDRVHVVEPGTLC